jgi:hypothetical protein
LSSFVEKLIFFFVYYTFIDKSDTKIGGKSGLFLKNRCEMDKKDREMTGKKNERCKAEVRLIGKLQQIGCYGAANTSKAEMDTLIPVSMRGQPLLKF